MGELHGDTGNGLLLIFPGFVVEGKILLTRRKKVKKLYRKRGMNCLYRISQVWY